MGIAPGLPEPIEPIEEQWTVFHEADEEEGWRESCFLGECKPLPWQWRLWGSMFALLQKARVTARNVLERPLVKYLDVFSMGHCCPR